MKRFLSLLPAYLDALNRRFYPIHGQIVQAHNRLVKGWVYNTRLTGPVWVRLYINHQFVAAQKADQEFRGVSRLKGDAGCGFHFELPHSLVSEDLVEVKAGLLRCSLENSPKRIPFLGSHAAVLNYFGEKNYAPPKVFFLHIPKTAGTTFRFVLKDYFGDAPVQPSPEVELKHRGYPHFHYPFELREQELEQCRYLCGHYSIVFRHLLGKNVQIVTFLRDPVARTISNLYQFKQKNKLFKSLSLMEIYLHLQRSMNNMQVRFLANDLIRDDIKLVEHNQVSQAEYEEARANLEKFFLVGLSEYFTESLSLLERKWETSLVRPKRRNISKSRPEVEPDLVSLITENNTYDIQLYEAAKLQFFAQCKLHGITVHSR
ncbi:MAG: hypothetical protein D6B25_10275 [Desulfobulbaceae bacterium]|nr:MAG: hypothetical protein D6B25_10275 [Desulfobulbaceae bacterium]